MNDHEAQRIAAAISAARPDWPAASLLTLIRKNLANRPRRDVFVALAWVACEAETKTPARVLEPGPWWRAVVVTDDASKTRDVVPPEERCATCSQPREVCQRVRTGKGDLRDDHPFESLADARRRRAERDPAPVAELRDIAATSAREDT